MKTGLVLTGMLAALSISVQATDISSVTVSVASQIGLVTNVITHVFGDYDGDGKSDLTVYRHGYWSIYSLTNGIILDNAGEWGGADWTPVQ